jgi:drug/metabolite transporter (DMT)-like permease
MVSVIDASLALGFGLALCAASCYDTGYALQALEARRAPAQAALRPRLLVHLARRPVWVGATLLSVAGWPLQVWALQHAPLTLVQPTLALGLVLLLVLGNRILGEHVGRREVTAVIAIITAVALIAWAAPSERGEVPRNAGLAIALGLLAAVAILPYVVGALGRRPIALLVIGAGAADGLAAFAAKPIAEHVSAGRWLAVAAWGVAVATVVVLGVISESTALQKAPATRVAPSVLAMQIAVPVLLAPLVGGESWGATPLSGAVLAATLGAVIVGVVTLAGSPVVAGVISEQHGGGRSRLRRSGRHPPIAIPATQPSGAPRTNDRARAARPGCSAASRAASRGR